MLFTKSASLAIAVASCSFFSGVKANNRYLFDDYSDLAASEPSTKYCLGRDIVEFGETSQEKYNKRSLEETSGLALRDILGANASGATKREITELLGRQDVHDIVKKHISASVGAELIANILGLIGVDAKTGAQVSASKRDEVHELVKKLLSASAAAEIAANILGLVGIDIKGGAGVQLSKKETKEILEREDVHEIVKKHISASVGAELIANILGLIGVDAKAGARVNVGKRQEIEMQAKELIKKHISAGDAARAAANVLSYAGVNVDATGHASLTQSKRSEYDDLKRDTLELVKKQISADAAAEIAGNILGLVGAGASVGGEVSASKREVEAEAGAELVGSILGLINAGAGIGGEVSASKREVDASAGGELVGSILGLINAGAGVGGEVSVSKRQLDASAGAEAIASILGLINVGAGIGGEVSVSKRQIDASAGAEAIASILGLINIGAGIGGEVHASKREIDAEAASGIAGDILGLIGAGAGAGIEGEVSKRDIETDYDHGFTLFEVVRKSYARTQKILNKVTGTVPKAAFIVSDVAWVEEDIFKVTINFETVESSQMFAKFQDELKSVKIQGTRDSSDIMLWDGSSDSKVDSFSKWSSTVLVKASKHNDLYCLPDNFAIKFDWNAKDTSELHKQWSQYFDTTYEYTLSQQFGQQRSSRLNVAKRCFESSNSTAVEDGKFDINVLDNWKASSSELPNFCWPKHCSV